MALGGWGGGGGREEKCKRNIFSGDGFSRENDYGGKENEKKEEEKNLQKK